MEKHVYFVRHGESESNAGGRHHGSTALLTEKGKEQARIVAERIAKIGVEALVSSSFPRAMATAEPIHELTGLPVEESDMFVERRRPSFVIGRSIEDHEVKRAMGEIFEGYVSKGHRHSDEENFDDLRTRAAGALTFLEHHPSSRICVVTHGTFLRVLFCAAMHGKDFTGENLQHAIRALATSNTGVSHFRFGELSIDSPVPVTRWIVVNWNDSAHLG
ncbi:histidine phosphatase family protein [Candidatus Kaiserbacteria bacterium]|nr:histidine phosphatase family protein [Candidatus Kaiserbacteria bacterium]